MQLVEMTAHCTRCHDLLTVTGIAIDAVGQKKRVLWLSPSYRLAHDGTYLIHRQPEYCDKLTPCGGRLMLIGSQREMSRYHHVTQSPSSTASSKKRTPMSHGTTNELVLVRAANE